MEIQIGGIPKPLPEGTLAVFVDPAGKVLGVGLVRGGVLQDAMGQILGDIDVTKDPHTEVEFKTSNVPPSGETIRIQGIDALRVCRDMSGNVVRCPPR